MKPRLLVLHGALGSPHQFAALKDALPDVDLIIPALHGHGQSPDLAEPWTIDLFTSQLENLLTDLHEDLHVFGYSMGGYIALRLALRRPDLISRIFTLGTKLSWTPEGASKEIRKLDAETIESKVPAFAADLRRRHGEEQWRTVLSKTAEMMIGLGAAPVLTPEMMQSISIPVRYGIGDRDEMVSLEETATFYRATPNAELAVLPRTRHPIEKVDMSLIVENVRRFLLS